MCGITGFIAPMFSREKRLAAIGKMTAALEHRGPDAQGLWDSDFFGVALGHRRLSILDLSSSGSQPFLSDNKKKILVFNGEVYNYRDLARELEALGHVFLGNGDTEVVSRAIQQWGCEEAIPRMAGMFALAIVDLEAGTLTLARDRMGEKPLFYGWNEGSFLFGSELKALTAFPGFKGEVRRSELGNFLRYGCIPSPNSIYENIFKLKAGTLLTLKIGAGAGSEKICPYWQLSRVAEAGVRKAASPFSDAKALTMLDGILRSVISEQSSADVEVGAFLSGGIDSSLVVALAQQHAQARGSNLQTFTIGFEQMGFDEAPFARATAAKLGTRHHEIYVGAAEALRVVERLPVIYDEPFADSSQIPTFLVAEWARTQVKVCLSGDGGDETFAGYNRHFIGTTFWAKMKHFPLSVRRRIAASWADCPSTLKLGLARVLGALARGKIAPQRISEKIDKLMTCLKAADYEEMYLSLLSLEGNPQRFLIENETPVDFLLSLPDLDGDPLFTMQYLDALFYLPDDILTKVDRASMAVGLEVRAPFLDHRLVEFAWTLSVDQRIRDGKGKWMLRALAEKMLDASVLDRPKSGFAIPIDAWLKGPLRAWAEDLLDSGEMARQGYFRVAEVHAAWRNYLAGRERNQYLIWNILMFQQWLRYQREQTATSEKRGPGELAPFPSIGIYAEK